jgi:hypothetical protein
MIRFILNRPRLAAKLMSIVDRFPVLKRKLKRMTKKREVVLETQVLKEEDLSERGREIYAMIQESLKERNR